MATKTPVILNLGDQDGSILSFAWTLNGTDDGAPMEWAQWADRSVQMSGTWGAGTVVWEGSNDGVTYFTLTDVQAAAISKTSDALEQVVEVTRFARPRASVSVTAVVVTALVRRQQPLRT